MQFWPNLFFASCYVSVPAGAPILVGSSGPIGTIEDIGVGHYRVNLTTPVPNMFSGDAVKGATLLPAAINNVFTGITATVISNTEIDVFTWDATGAALDASFCLAIFEHTDRRAPA